MAFALVIEPGEQAAAPGSAAVFGVRVSNLSDIVDRVVLDVLGPAGAWSVVEPSELSLFPRSDGAATISLTPPAGAASGPVAFGVRATGTASGLIEVGEATLVVAPSHTIEAQLRPRTATGTRRATSVVVLHNAGNAPTAIELAASDPDDAIVFDAPTAVEVAPGETAELPLRMRLPSRPKQGSTLPYTVVVTGAGSGQSLDGQVRQPPRKRWPLVAALLLLGLAAAAFLALRPEDSVAVAGGSPDEASTTSSSLAGVPGDSTTTAALVTSAPPPGETTVAPPTSPPPGATTTAAPPPGGTTTSVSIGGIPRPSTSSTSITPLACPAKGDAATTARRVVCAWEFQRLGEVSDSTTTQVATDLNAVLRVGAGAAGQRVESVAADATGSTVFFDRCGNGRGVRSVRVPSTGTDAGKVSAFQRCPSLAISG